MFHRGLRCWLLPGIHGRQRHTLLSVSVDRVVFRARLFGIAKGRPSSLPPRRLPLDSANGEIVKTVAGQIAAREIAAGEIAAGETAAGALPPGRLPLGRWPPGR